MSPGQTNCNNCGGQLSEQELSGKGHGPRGTLICGGCEKKAKAQRRSGWQPQMLWEGNGYDGLRLTSGAPIPWSDSNVAMIRISRDGEVETAHTRGGKQEILEEAAVADMILVAWPGSRRQDVFIVDDRQAAHNALAKKAS
jgi:hypothetical protein